MLRPAALHQRFDNTTTKFSSHLELVALATMRMPRAVATVNILALFTRGAAQPKGALSKTFVTFLH